MKIKNWNDLVKWVAKLTPEQRKQRPFIMIDDELFVGKSTGIGDDNDWDTEDMPIMFVEKEYDVEEKSQQFFPYPSGKGKDYERGQTKTKKK